MSILILLKSPFYISFMCLNLKFFIFLIISSCNLHFSRPERRYYFSFFHLDSWSLCNTIASSLRNITRSKVLITVNIDPYLFKILHNLAFGLYSPWSSGPLQGFLGVASLFKVHKEEERIGFIDAFYQGPLGFPFCCNCFRSGVDLWGSSLCIKNTGAKAKALDALFLNFFPFLNDLVRYIFELFAGYYSHPFFVWEMNQVKLLQGFHILEAPRCRGIVLGVP